MYRLISWLSPDSISCRSEITAVSTAFPSAEIHKQSSSRLRDKSELPDLEVLGAWTLSHTPVEGGMLEEQWGVLIRLYTHQKEISSSVVDHLEDSNYQILIYNAFRIIRKEHLTHPIYDTTHFGYSTLSFALKSQKIALESCSPTLVQSISSNCKFLFTNFHRET